MSQFQLNLNNQQPEWKIIRQTSLSFYSQERIPQLTRIHLATSSTSNAPSLPPAYFTRRIVPAKNKGVAQKRRKLEPKRETNAHTTTMPKPTSLGIPFRWVWADGRVDTLSLSPNQNTHRANRRYPFLFTWNNTKILNGSIEYTILLP